MKPKMCFQRFFATLLLLAVSILSWAYSFQVGGIYYNINEDGKSVTVTNWQYDRYSGSVVIPSSATNITYDRKTYRVTSIGQEAFSGCYRLTSITIPNSVTSIGQKAFSGCYRLTSITIPNSVTSISENAFYGCSGLTSVTVNSDAIVSKANSSRNLGTIFGSQVKEIIIGDDVTSIGYSAFSGCSSLKSVTIGNNVTSIGQDAFKGCSSLKSITIPNNVTSIDRNAFSSLTSVTLNSNTIVSKKYYNSDYNLSTIFGTQVKEYIIGEDVKSIAGYAFEGCFGLTSVTIGNGVTSIGSHAFYDCSGLTSITIPNSVKSIGYYAFSGCSSLTSVTIPNSVTDIGYSAFSGCSNLTSVTLNTGDIVSKTYSSSHNLVTTFGAQVEEYVIGSDVTRIGVAAFKGCSDLKSVTIGNGVKSIDSYAFSGCSSLTSVTIIGNGVTEIGGNAFTGCSGLTKAEFASIESLCNILFLTSESNPLYYAHHLYIDGQEVKDVVIPESVTSIGYYAFYGCSSLTSVTLGNSVTEIGGNAFTGCSALTSVTCMADNVPSTINTAFYDVPLDLATLYVPVFAVDAYKKEYPWMNFGKILLIGGNSGDDCIYIGTDLTAQFPIDWQGWNGATGYVGWAAPKVTTNDGRETPACEKFNGNSAEQGTVFTRTLTGLANGIYRIELYGAAASTKGRDTGIDSEMTAADEGDETAVYLYAKTASGIVKQYIPVHWATSFSEIATAVLNGVTVTDGTVELGMVSNKKFTNWHVVQIKGITALVEATELHSNTLTRAQETLNDVAYVNVVGSERTALTQAISDNTTVSEQTAEAYQAAINALETAMKTFTDAKGSYEGFAAAKTKVGGISYPYATEAKKFAAENAIAAVATSAADAASKTDALLTAYRQYAESSAMMEGLNGATDMTSYIKNPKADEDIDASVWQTILGAGFGGSISILHGQPWTDGSGDSNHRYFDGGNWGASAWDVTFKQDITLPAGKYQLTAIGRSEQDVALTLFAGEETAEMAHTSSVGGLFNNGWEQTSVEFELTEYATVSIGVRGVTSVIHNWMSFSDFRLVQFPEATSQDITLEDIRQLIATYLTAGSSVKLSDIVQKISEYLNP